MGPKARKCCVRRDGSGSGLPLELRSPNSVLGVAGFEHKPACRAASKAKSQVFARRNSPPGSKSPGWRPPQGLFTPQAKRVSQPGRERPQPHSSLPRRQVGLRAQRRLGPGGQGGSPPPTGPEDTEPWQARGAHPQGPGQTEPWRGRGTTHGPQRRPTGTLLGEGRSPLRTQRGLSQGRSAWGHRGHWGPAGEGRSPAGPRGHWSLARLGG